MKRNFWGEIRNMEPCEDIKLVPLSAKREKIFQIESKGDVTDQSLQTVKVKVKNSFVTQTIEVMKQTEMLQSLIDTYSNKSGSSNYLLNPCQVIPEIDFPLENAIDFVCEDKFVKPFWFIPPKEIKFAHTVPQKYPHINGETCSEALRKATCGQLRVAGFTDIAETALILFKDAIESFMRYFLDQIKDSCMSSRNATQSEIDVNILEKSYYSLNNVSIVDVHNFFKQNLIARNRAEISEFNAVRREYDSLMKESQKLQKEFQEGDLLNILEISANPNEDMRTTSTQLSEIENTQENPIMTIVNGQSYLEHESV